MSATPGHEPVLDRQVRGQGPPVVLVHGSASDRRTWQVQEPVFAEHFRTISYSRRYHWPNDPIGDDDYVMDEHVDDLRRLLDDLDERPAHLVGHSYGGFLCLLLALRWPERVQGLVLIESPVVPLFVSDPPRPNELLRLMASRPRTAWAIMKFGTLGVQAARRAARRGDLDKAVHRFGSAVLGKEALADLSEQRWQQVRANNIRAEYVGSGFAHLTVEETRRVHAPTLLITGDRSPALFHHLTDRLAELLPNARQVQIPGASHLVHEDNPECFNDLVLRFLAGLPGHVSAPDANMTPESGDPA